MVIEKLLLEGEKAVKQNGKKGMSNIFRLCLIVYTFTCQMHIISKLLGVKKFGYKTNTSQFSHDHIYFRYFAYLISVKNLKPSKQWQKEMKMMGIKKSEAIKTMTDETWDPIICGKAC